MDLPMELASLELGHWTSLPLVWGYLGWIDIGVGSRLAQMIKGLRRRQPKVDSSAESQKLGNGGALKGYDFNRRSGWSGN
jgi:hypothetical protein